MPSEGRHGRRRLSERETWLRLGGAAWFDRRNARKSAAFNGTSHAAARRFAGHGWHAEGFPGKVSRALLRHALRRVAVRGKAAGVVGDLDRVRCRRRERRQTTSHVNNRIQNV